MIDPLTIPDEPTARAHADMIVVGEIDDNRKAMMWLSVAVGFFAFCLCMVTDPWNTSAASGLLVGGLGIGISFESAHQEFRTYDALSWNQRKVKASEILRRQRNSAD